MNIISRSGLTLAGGFFALRYWSSPVDAPKIPTLA